ncbi:MAG: lectin like domain-containing protein [Clostridiales bacterium]|nr:lectin like domain-containing protein [Clostridiales bacterium]
MLKLKKILAAFLSAAIIFEGIPAQAYAQDAAWYDGLVINDVDDAAIVGASVLAGDDDVTLAGTTSRTVTYSDGVTLPSAYMNDISEVESLYPSTRDQGDYGTCWAFSSVALAEFGLISKGLVARSIDFSELQLIYFAYNHVTDPLGGTAGDLFSFRNGNNMLDMGGNYMMAARALMQWIGLADETDVPYSSASYSMKLSSSLAYSDDMAHLQNVYVYDVNSQMDALKEAIMENGAAGIYYCATDDIGNRNMYEGWASYDGQQVWTVYRDYRASSNHAVAIVGWDDDFPASNFKSRPRGDGAWLVRNSWDDEDSGYVNGGCTYFWLSYYDATLDSDAYVFDYELADNYDYNYQYDGDLICTSVLGFDAVANVFTVSADANEELEAVSISLTDCSDVSYTVKIFTDLNNAKKPRSGFLAAKISGQTEYPGIYTITLDEPISLKKGTMYSVEVDVATKNAQVDMEYSYNGSYFATTAAIQAGQSFAIYGGAWEDVLDLNKVYGTGNFAIKAYTDSLEGDSVGAVSKASKVSKAKKEITISWTKASNADGYEIFRATKKNGKYVKIGEVSADEAREYTDTGLKKYTKYYYRVRAYSDNETDKTVTRTVGKMSDSTGIRTKKK